MRSLQILVALAIAGSLDLVAAGNCKPSGTATGTVPPSTTTEAPIVVTNVMINGDYGGYDPRAYGGIYAFEGGGEAKLLQGPGYQGDGSRESNCVQLLRRSSTPAKRDTPPENPWIQQRLEDMEPSDYTVRFWYVVLSNSIADTCRIEGFYGGDMFGATPYFPVVEDAVGDNWVPFVELMPVTTSSGMIRFELSCVDGGAAEVYFDQVFVSNQVSPDDMDNISLFFPTARHAATVPPGQSTTLSATTSGDLETFTTELSSKDTTTAGTVTKTSTGTEDAGIESTTLSASPPTDSAAPPTPKRCAKLVPGAPGRGCAKRPYNSNQGYKRFPESRILREQCAALCLADTNCQSFEWTYRASGCGNTCVLIAALRDDGPTNGGSDAAWAYDRTCIQEAECSPQPDGTVCVNVVADTPSKSCTQLKGKAKACAKPFLTAGPDSFWFTDMDCHACGEGNAHFEYLAPLQDPANMPVWSCPAVEPETSAGISTTADAAVSETSSVGISGSTSTANVPDSSLPWPSTTVTSPPTTTDVDDHCPEGIAFPGACSRASTTPDGSTCSKNGIPEWIDAYGRSLEDFPNQNTVEDCALVCKQDTMCKAFGFDATARFKCRFSPEVMADAHFVEDPSNPVMWNDMKCMDCVMCGEDTAPTTTKPVSPPEITCAAAVNDGRGCRYKNNDEFPQDGNGRPVKPFVCMSNGSINQEPWSPAGDWPFQNSIPQCAAICAQVPDCKASAWNRRTNRCEFISSSLKDAGYRGVEGSEVFWSDNECWDCSGLCDDDSGETGTWTGSWSTQSATTMLTSTRRADEEEPSTTQPATTEPEENTTSRAPTTTRAASPEPTDCAVPSASLSDTVTCGIPGAAGNQVQTYRLQDFIIKPVGSLSACASLCLQRADCRGIEYNRQDTVCYLYRVGPADLGVQYNTQSTRRFYDRGCFKCD
ncbi:hypothetical protein ACJZ2D_012685 [Fusarium nematophilum]